MSGRKRKLRKMNQLQAVGIIIFLALLAVGYHQYSKPKDLKEIMFLRPDGSSTATLSVSVAHTNRSRKKGLMFVKDLPKNQGMLFIFPEEQQLTFHMKNTYLPLDMIFVNRQKKVVGILHDVPPLNQIKRKVDKPSIYVVELNSGQARELQISEGSRLVLPAKVPVAE